MSQKSFTFKENRLLQHCKIRWMYSIITTVTWPGLKTALELTKYTPVHIPQAVYADHYKTPQLPPTLCHNPLPLQPPVCRSLQL